MTWYDYEADLELRIGDLHGRVHRRALSAFRHYVIDLWRRTLRRRSQKDGFTWERMTKLVADWLPPPRILHPWPDDRFDAPKVGAGCLSRASPDLCGGRPAMAVPTAKA